jgi:hypothetical protein
MILERLLQVRVVHQGTGETTEHYDIKTKEPVRILVLRSEKYGSELSQDDLERAVLSVADQTGFYVVGIRLGPEEKLEVYELEPFAEERKGLRSRFERILEEHGL